MRSLLLLLIIGCISCAPETGSTVPKENVQLQLLLQPLGSVDHHQLDSAAAALSREHDAVVRIARPIELPASAHTNIRTPRYRADTLIAWLRAIKPDSADLIIGITQQDISITKYDSTGRIKEPAWKYRDFGIFGLGYIGGPSCVVSTFRLGEAPIPRFFDRLKKIAVHEVGHNRALPHCTDAACVMRDAVERIASIDAASAGFCTACRTRLALR